MRWHPRRVTECEHQYRRVLHSGLDHVLLNLRITDLCLNWIRKLLLIPKQLDSTHSCVHQQLQCACFDYVSQYTFL